MFDRASTPSCRRTACTSSISRPNGSTKRLRKFRCKPKRLRQKWGLPLGEEIEWPRNQRSTVEVRSVGQPRRVLTQPAALSYLLPHLAFYLPTRLFLCR